MLQRQRADQATGGEVGEMADGRRRGAPRHAHRPPTTHHRGNQRGEREGRKRANEEMGFALPRRRHRVDGLAGHPGGDVNH